MTGDKNKFSVDFGDEDTLKAIGNLNLNIESTTAKLLQIKEQIEIIESLQIEEAYKDKMREIFILTSLDITREHMLFEFEIQRLAFRYIKELFHMINKNTENLYESSSMVAYSACAEVFQTCIRLHGFLAALKRNDKEYLNQLYVVCEPLFSADSSELLQWFDDDGCANYSFISQLFKIRGLLNALAAEELRKIEINDILNLPQFKQFAEKEKNNQ